VVQWDQRGTGKTLGKNGKDGTGEMSIGRMVNDGIEVAEFLRTHLKKERIVLFAHSWGTVLGVPMATQRPDLFSAYIGAGQITNMLKNEAESYSMILDAVKASGDGKSLMQLESIGPPPYPDIKTWMVKGRMAVMFAPASASGRELPNVFTAALTTPSYSLKDGYDLFAAFDFSTKQLYDEMMAYDAGRYGATFKIPVLILQGEFDLQAPTNLAAEYFEKISAPKKDLVILKGETHTAVLVVADRFLEEIKTKLRLQID